MSKKKKHHYTPTTHGPSSPALHSEVLTNVAMWNEREARTALRRRNKPASIRHSETAARLYQVATQARIEEYGNGYEQE